VTLVVVGAHGLLGSHLVAELTRRRLPHLAVSRTPANHVPSVDLRSEADVDQLCGLVGDATVVYCAQVGGRARTAADPDEARRVNVTAPARLARAARRMIYLSSDYVFTTAGTKYPHTPPDPADAYSVSKADGEREVLAAGRHAMVVRTSGLYDERTGPLGDFTGLDTVTAADNRTTQPTYLPDLITALLDLLGEVSGIVHAVGPHTLSAYEFAQIASLRWGFNVRPVLSQPRESVILEPTPGLAIRPPAHVFLPDRPHPATPPIAAPVTVLDTVGVVLAGRRHREPDPDFWAEQAAGPETPLARLGADRIVAAYGPNPAVWPRLHRLTPGRTYVLANNGPRETFERWVARYGLDRLFAHTINSERDGLTKAREPFRARVNALAGPHRVQLIDDSPAIVAEATRSGWDAVMTRRTGEGPVEEYTPEAPIR
jgi:dTDP-4-dehydrorhamnose reductase